MEFSVFYLQPPATALLRRNICNPAFLMWSSINKQEPTFRGRRGKQFFSCSPPLRVGSMNGGFENSPFGAATCQSAAHTSARPSPRCGRASTRGRPGPAVPRWPPRRAAVPGLRAPRLLAGTSARPTRKKLETTSIHSPLPQPENNRVYVYLSVYPFAAFLPSHVAPLGKVLW